MGTLKIGSKNIVSLSNLTCCVPLVYRWMPRDASRLLRVVDSKQSEQDAVSDALGAVDLSVKVPM